MSVGHEGDHDLESVVERFKTFVEGHCTIYSSPEGRPTPDSLGDGEYVLDRLPGTPFENVEVSTSVTEIEMSEGMQTEYSLSYHTADGDEIMTIMCTPSEERPFWTSNGGEVDTYDMSPEALVGVMGDVTYWENSGAMVPAPAKPSN